MRYKFIILFLSLPVIAYSFPPPTSFDRNTTEAIADLKKYNGVETIYEGLSFISSNEMILGYALFMTAFGESTMHNAGKVATAGFISAEITATILKFATNRERPSGPVKHRWQSSFPSGHTSSAFSMAYTISKYYPRWRIPLFVLATGVGISRIGLNQHWTTDVVAGAIIGLGSGFLAVKLEEKILSFRLKL